MASTEIADAMVEVLHSCGCCLQRASHIPGNMKIYWTMLQECFNIKVIEASKYGICRKCASRLRDASKFKLQVQRSQAELQARLGSLRATYEEPEVELVAEDRTSDHISNTDPLLAVEVVIKREPPEEASSSVDLAGQEDPEQLPASCSVSEQPPGEHFLLGADDASTSVCGESDDATIPAAREPKTDHTAKTMHPCKICGKEFRFPGSLRRHTRLHNGEKLYPCDVCEKSFSQSCHLQEHKLIHTGIKPHSCETCKKRFTHKNSLTQHISLHDVKRDRPYVCEVCNKNFARLGALKTHERIHSGEKPYACEICYKAFTLPEGLRRHKFTHSDEKPFPCEICHKRFSDTGDLKKHIRTHTGEKPYSCEICEKKFAQLSNLKQHLLIHTGAKPHVCEVCQRRFTKSSHLKVHMRLHPALGSRAVAPVACVIESNLDEEGS
ncbi:zinc finger protein OZF-like [Cydia pomonella]|uniref:zinc finger protein OZF-like n=1 Tax=Cydia pomonella TaxID=82600 RepID=UPI002ADE55C8|nr:zinc finger protein OZF-like [Cydia pomonella]